MANEKVEDGNVCYCGMEYCEHIAGFIECQNQVMARRQARILILESRIAEINNQLDRAKMILSLPKEASTESILLSIEALVRNAYVSDDVRAERIFHLASDLFARAYKNGYRGVDSARDAVKAATMFVQTFEGECK